MVAPFDPCDRAENATPLDDTWAARRCVADVARRLIEALATTAAGKETLCQLTNSLEAHLESLNEQPKVLGRKVLQESENGRYRDSFIHRYELSPVEGRSNPLAPPLKIWMDDNKVHGRVTLGWQYEGPAGAAHGGAIAALLDHLLAVGQRLSGQYGMTGELNTRYIRPTPLNSELRLVGWVEKVIGRACHMHGEIWAGETLTASGEGTFISYV